MLRSKYEPRIIISGVDIAQRLSGVSLKLLAYEKLLSDYPIWQERVVLVQKCLIPNSRRSDEINTIRELRYLVRRIKEKFGPKVIDYEELAGSSVPIDQRLALWKTADVIMATPIREGLSLLPMEFIYTRKAPLVPGVIIWVRCSYPGVLIVIYSQIYSYPFLL
jgi:trehalose-6-phosphate synthase